ncbi:hypothetical protein R6Q57_019972 [Mikania cordata]
MYGFLSNPNCSSINLQGSVSISENCNMTMFPAHLSSSRCINGGFSDGGCDCFISLGRGFCSDLMAEDESRTETSINNEEAGSSMKDDHVHDDHDDDHSRWLQLSLGGGHIQTTNHSHRMLTAENTAPPSVNLDLLSGVDDGGLSRQIPLSPPPVSRQLLFSLPEFLGSHRPTPTVFFLQPNQTAAPMNSAPFVTLQQQQQHETNYNYMQLTRQYPTNVNPQVSSSSTFSGSPEQHGRPIHVHRRLNVARVINPPRRLHSGVWFMLQASQNQAKEPFLPQIPKSYLRIKDGRMTVGLLIKYLVNKLELGSESEGRDMTPTLNEHGNTKLEGENHVGPK